MKRVLTLAWPIIVENIAYMLVSFVDTAMVGQLGETATAAVAVNASPSWLMGGMTSMIQVGATVLVAQSIGAGNKDAANRVARQALTIGALIGAFFMVFIQLAADSMPVWLRAEPAVVPLASKYIRIVSLGYILHFTGMVLSGILRGAGDTATPMKLNIFTSLLNVVGNFFMIYEPRTVSVFGAEIPVWGAGLGVIGAAIPSAFSQGLGGLLLFLKLTRKGGVIRFEKHQSYRPQWRVVKEMLRIGLPSATERICVNIGQIVFQTMVAGLGTASLAAHHLSVTAESLAYMPAYGFSAAATTLVGQSVGAGDIPGARRLGSLAILTGTLIMSAMAIILLVWPDRLLSLFTAVDEVIAIGVPALRIEALAEPLFGISIVCGGALSGAGDTRTPMIIGLSTMWGLRITVAAFCLYALNMGLAGAWIGMAVDLSVRGILLLIRFRSDKWEKIAAQRRTV